MKTIAEIESKVNNFLNIQWGTEEAEIIMADRRMIWDNDVEELNKFYQRYKEILNDY